MKPWGRSLNSMNYIYTYIYIYVYINTHFMMKTLTKKSLESNRTLWRDKVTLQKVGVTSWRYTNVKTMNITTKKNTLRVSVAGREIISPIILAQTEMNWICTRPRRVIAAENLTACVDYESKRDSDANDVILLPENINRMMGLWIRNTFTVQKPIAEQHCPGYFHSKPRIQ